MFVFYDEYRKIMSTIKKRTSKRIKQNGYMYTDNKSSFEKKKFRQHTTNVYIKKRVCFADITASFKTPKKFVETILKYFWNVIVAKLS